MIRIREFEGIEFKNDVILFKDQFFLHQENSGQRQFDYLLGNLKLDKNVINNFQKNIKHNIAISENNFSYKHIVFPSKPLSFVNEFKSIGLNISPLFSESHKLKNVIYPEVSISDYDTDGTHCNDLATYRILNQTLLELNYQKLPEPITKIYNRVHELGAMLNSNSSYETKKIVGFEGVINNSEKIERVSLAPYLKGNTGHFDYSINPYAIYNKRIILFGDSFFRSKIHIFERVFSEVIYFRVPYILEDITKILKPDLVLTGNAERYLMNVPSVESPKPWFLNYLGHNFNNKNISAKELALISILFSGRDSTEFKEFIESRKAKLPKNIDLLANISVSEVKRSIEIDLIRDAAIQCESIDLNLSLKLMNIAKQLRKDGPLINKKLAFYEKKISLGEKKVG